MDVDHQRVQVPGAGAADPRGLVEHAEVSRGLDQVHEVVAALHEAVQVVEARLVARRPQRLKPLLVAAATCACERGKISELLPVSAIMFSLPFCRPRTICENATFPFLADFCHWTAC